MLFIKIINIGIISISISCFELFKTKTVTQGKKRKMQENIFSEKLVDLDWDR